MSIATENDTSRELSDDFTMIIESESDAFHYTTAKNDRLHLAFKLCRLFLKSGFCQRITPDKRLDTEFQGCDKEFEGIGDN